MKGIRAGHLHVVAVGLSVVLVASACSGAKRETTTTGTEQEVAGAVTDEGNEGSPEPGASGRTTRGRATAGSGGAADGGTTLTTPQGVTVTAPEGGGPPVANLFRPEEDRIGLHDDKIVFCAHAATSFGPAFNTSEADLNVYWDEVGKIHGRDVEITFENDNYSPNDARVAAEACKQKDPFVLLGGIGFDQIPAVRKFAEDNRMPYVHHIASEDFSKRFAFSSLPSVEQVGAFAGQWVSRKYPGKRVGVIYRESENWEPGHKTFLEQVRKTNPIPVDVGVAQNKGNYFTEIQAFIDEEVEVGFIWENALAATNIIQQAKGRSYHPKWVIFPFNVTTDTLGSQALSPEIDGIATWPAYSPGDYSGPFAEYADEIGRMEEVYARRRPGIQATDIHWMVWLAWRDLHRTLLECGRDCTRNKFVGLLLWRPYTFEETKPLCAVDFTRNGHVGGFWATVFTSYGKGGGRAGWRHIPGEVCKESLL